MESSSLDRRRKPWGLNPTTCALVSLLLVTVACAQSAPNLKGIKVKESSFDLQTHVVRLTFINDSIDEITAWDYCVQTVNSSREKPEHGYCTLVDPSYTVIDHKIELKTRPLLPEPDCAMCRFIHPGEAHVLSADLSQFPEIVTARIEINLLAFSDGGVEIASNRRGKIARQQLRARRQQLLEINRKAVEIAKEALADSNNPHPVASVIGKLSDDRKMEAIVEWLKKPEWHLGNEHQYVPEKEREYLARFVAEHEAWIAILLQHQIKGDIQ
jgi:hypothetical protein